MAAALIYTAANMCLRAVSDDCDPMWVACMKALPILVLIGPYVLFRALRGRQVLLAPGVLGLLVFGALLDQFIGNTLYQWALWIVGIALAVPLILGVILVVGALMGRVFLGERVAGRSVVAIVMLLAAISLLGWAAKRIANGEVQMSSSASDGSTQMHVMLALLALVAAGCAYATLGVILRRTVSGGAPLSSTIVVCGLVGVLGLGTATYFRIGGEKMWNTNPHDMTLMLMAGFYNTTAFLSLIKAFQLTTVTHVNALSSSQSAMAAVAGVAIFHEPLSLPLVAGIVLTIVGLTLMKGPDN